MREKFLHLTRALGLATLFAALAVPTAAAQDPVTVVNGQQIELGKTYVIPGDFKSHNCWFQATKDGEITVDANPQLTIFSDEAGTKEVPQKGEGAFVGAIGYVYNFDATAGTKYYINVGFAMNTQRFCITEAGSVELALTENYPAIGSVLSTTPSADVEFYFNGKINNGLKAEITANGQTATVSVITYGVRATVPCTATMNKWYDEGTLNAGDEITVTVKGVKIEGADAAGQDFTATYVAAARAANKLGQTIPNPFKSYWRVGDPDAVMSLTFDQEMAQGAVCEIYYGNPDTEGGYYVEQVPAVTEGQTIKVDFAGKRRSAQEMVVLDSYPTVISMKLMNVKSADGQYAASTDQGSIGSFSYTTDFLNLERKTVASEFTPANGGTLRGVDNLEVYVRGVSALAFDGFKFAYKSGDTEAEAVVALADCQSATDASDPDAVTYTVPVPEAVKAGCNGVTVTLANLESIDGFDYSEKVKAVYDTFVITFSDPAQDAVIEKLNYGDEITVETNWSSLYPEMYLEGEIRDLNATSPDKEYITGLYPRRQDDGSYKATIWLETKFIKGHTYKAEFTAYETENDSHVYAEGARGPLATAYFTFEGASEPFKVSDNKLVSLTPANYSTLESVDQDLVITATFDGMVNVDRAFINLGSGMESDFASVTCDEPYTDPDSNKDYSSVWHFTATQYDIAQGITFAFRAYDQDGLLVFYQEGIEAMQDPYEEFMFQGEYYAPAGSNTVDFVTEPADDAEVASLSQIVFKSIDGMSEIMPSWNVPIDELTVMTMQGQVVARGNGMDLGWSGEMDYYIGLDTPVTEAGSYVIYIPEGYMNVGEMGDPTVEKYVRVYVTGGEAPVPTEVKYHAVPAEGDVTSLKEVSLIFDEISTFVDLTWADQVKMYVDGVEGYDIWANDCVAASSEDPDNWDLLFDRIVITLPEAQTAVGKYEFVFPAGSIYLDADNMVSHNEEIRLTYNIKESDGVDNIAADANAAQPVYNVAGVYLGKFNKAELSKLPAGFYIVGGNKTYIK